MSRTYSIFVLIILIICSFLSCKNFLLEPENQAPYAVTAAFTSQSFKQGEVVNTFQMLIDEQDGLKDPEGDTVYFRSSTLPAWMTLDENTGIVTVDTADIHATVTISFWSEDENSADTSDTPHDVLVSVYNNPPYSVTGSARQDFHQGTLSNTFQMSIDQVGGLDDPEGDTVFFRSSTLPAWITSLDPNTGVVTVDTSEVHAVETISFWSEDENGEDTMTSSFDVQVSVYNTAPYPVTAGFGSQSFKLGTVTNTFQMMIEEVGGLKDPDGDTVVFRSSTLPGWILMDENTGIVTIDTSAIQTAVNISFWSEDEFGENTSANSFDVLVSVYNNPPYPVTGSTPQAFHQGELVNNTFQLSIVQVAGLDDPDGDSVVFRSNAPAWMILDETTGIVTVDTAAVHAVQTVSFWSEDENGEDSSGSLFDVDVSVYNNAPYVVTAGFTAQSFHQGDVSNTFQMLIDQVAGEDDPDGDTVVFRSSALPAWITLDANTGLVTVDTAVVHAVETISFWSEDEFGAETSGTSHNIDISVYNNAPYAVTAGFTEQSFFQYAASNTFQMDIALVGGFKDPDDDTVYFRSDAPAWISLNADTGVVTVNTAEVHGVETVLFWSEDEFGAETSGTAFSVSVEVLSNNPVAEFYTYDYRISGSSTTGVNGDYTIDISVPSGSGPGYKNDSNIYIYRFTDTDYYWGIYGNYSESTKENVYYYLQYLYADLNMGPEEAGWTAGTGTGAVSISTGSAIVGSLEYGRSVTGNYIFTDPNGDSEGSTSYKWYLCATNAADDEGEEIVGATSLTYTFPDGNIETLNSGFVNKDNMFLKFGVTPVDEFGNAGAEVKSPASYNSFPGL